MAVSGRIGLPARRPSGLPARRPTKASHVSDQQPRFREVPSRVDFPALDARVLAFWKEHRIFEKSLDGRDDAPVYVFYEGPPTANGHPVRTTSSRASSRTSFRATRRCAAIACRARPAGTLTVCPWSSRSSGSWASTASSRSRTTGSPPSTSCAARASPRTSRSGSASPSASASGSISATPTTRSTTSTSRSVWWLLRQIWDKGLLYQGHKVVPYCPRCGTAISSHEVAQGYKDVTEDSIYVRFPLRPRRRPTLGAPAGAPVALAVWTTTPWTLISNVSAAVHPRSRTRSSKSRRTFRASPASRSRRCSARTPSSSVSSRAVSCSASSTRRRSPSWTLGQAGALRRRRRLRHDQRRYGYRAHGPGVWRGRHACRSRE